MKKLVLVVAWLVLVPLFAACATGSPVDRRTTQGGLYGAGLGALAGALITGTVKGAAAGGLIGAGVGAIAGAAIGTAEAKAVYTEPQPLPWLAGVQGQPPKSIQVVGRSGAWGYGMDVSLPVLEDNLKRRGAIVVRNPGPQYYPTGQPESVATDYLAEFNATERADAVMVDLQVFNTKTKQLIATGSHTAYFNGYGYGLSVGGVTSDPRVEALRTASKNAVWALH